MRSIPSEQERVREAPASELIRRLFADVRIMLEGEARLAKLELDQKASRLRSAAVLLASSAVVAIFAVGVLVAAAVLGLSLLVPAWAAALIVGAVLVTVAVVLFAVGRASMRSVGSLVPTEAIDAAREDVAWTRRETERLRSTE